ncbi:GNAT family N-acetyltransferase [Actinoplanes sp. LDG1-06]|uniref:GNAT family N-acetyltransferase n=1 Tax=Paractinoplanes ovalisporus TaxID=2810368 RepID=A0ABS2A560_9ACTN|nr:GNAT family N-acetyltransferase [Actinoplanes ovalisporus]MBM2614980.1 GNAT family N-acetyltransferase [Actinoplanes ovalisporus]
MSDLLSPATAAKSAAEAAGVEVRILTELAELHDVCRLFDSIWQSDPADPPVTRDLLRAMSKAGNYVAGAFDRTGMIGACIAFFGPPERREMHSHIAGVTRAARGRSVGGAIKLHQRAWALRQGVTTISWTFDPLVGRNAYFNLVKLGGEPVQYLPHFYGPMSDGINSADDTDRLLLRWDLASPRVDLAVQGLASPVDVTGAAFALERTPDGEPAPRPADTRTVLVAVPADIETLRREDPACARRWRLAVRETLAPLIDGGARVTGFDRAGWYVVERQGS